MMAVASSKLTIPPLPFDHIERVDLCAGLDAMEAPDVALVCAPAGYGKSLLLAEWARTSTATETAWVALDREDNDPHRLWASVIAAVAGCPSVPSTSRFHLRTGWPPATEPVIGELVEALQRLPQAIRLVLDDVHELTDPNTLRGMHAFLRTKPPSIQFVLASRLDPPLSLPRLRLARRLWELRAEQLSFTPDQAALLLERSGLRLSRPEVDVLHRRTGGWAAGLRLAALELARSTDRELFLAGFSGNNRFVSDYLAGEVLPGLAADVRSFLRVISISDPVPVGLATELTNRPDAGRVLDRLEARTSLVSATGPGRESYRIQELLRTHLLGDLRRDGVRRTEELHARAARWWAAQDQPLQALDHAVGSHDAALTTDLLHRYAPWLVLTGDHEPLRRAIASLGARETAADPWLSLTSALADLQAGALSTAQSALCCARRSWPADPTADLVVLRTVTEQFGATFGATSGDRTPVATVDLRAVSPGPELEALTHLSRGTARLEQDPVGARSEIGAALRVGRRHGFDYLTMQCLALLGVVSGTAGDLPTMRTASGEALVIAADHGWESSIWSGAAGAMSGYAELLASDPAAAERRTAEVLAAGSTDAAATLRYLLRAVHGAAVFDRGENAAGLAELQSARTEFGDGRAKPEHLAAMAMLEYRAAQQLGHSAAARTALTWLTGRTGECGEAAVMQAWGTTAAGRPDHARALVRTVLDGKQPPLLPYTMVDAWLLETSCALKADERAAARHALRNALNIGRILDTVRPFTRTGPDVRELLVHLRGSFGASEAFADRVLVAGAGRCEESVLTGREIAVLELLPTLLSLEEVAADLTISINTVKTHMRSIYTKLGVGNRRLAVLAAHTRGLLASGVD
jgi:LuxR family maltose regulon positive regulatory protein